MHTQLTVSRSSTWFRPKYSHTAAPTDKTEQTNCRTDRPKKERFTVGSNFLVDFDFHNQSPKKEKQVAMGYLLFLSI